MARSLKSGRSGIVGVVVAGSIRRAFQNPVALATMAGLSEALDEPRRGAAAPARPPRAARRGRAAARGHARRRRRLPHPRRGGRRAPAGPPGAPDPHRRRRGTARRRGRRGRHRRRPRHGGGSPGTSAGSATAASAS
ncbi:hypothetical protein [Clavibacter tessellarius]|uniref:hypothetical protein n=1 Tax=Clavibacter tessellarius TaxID=31965 RepID=UPI003244D54B